MPRLTARGLEVGTYIYVRNRGKHARGVVQRVYEDARHGTLIVYRSDFNMCAFTVPIADVRIQRKAERRRKATR